MRQPARTDDRDPSIGAGQRPSERGTERAAAGEPGQRRRERVHDERHHGHVDPVEQVLHRVRDPVVDRHPRREGEVETGVVQVVEEREREGGIDRERAFGRAVLTGRGDLADAEQERGHQIEPEPAEVVRPDDHDGIGPGRAETLTRVRQTLPERDRPIEVRDRVPVGVHQRGVRRTDPQHDTHRARAPVILRYRPTCPSRA